MTEITLRKLHLSKPNPNILSVTLHAEFRTENSFMDMELRGLHSFKNYKFQILKPNWWHCGASSPRNPFGDSLFSTHACGGGNMLCQESGNWCLPSN